MMVFIIGALSYALIYLREPIPFCKSDDNYDELTVPERQDAAHVTSLELWTLITLVIFPIKNLSRALLLNLLVEQFVQNHLSGYCTELKWSWIHCSRWQVKYMLIIFAQSTRRNWLQEALLCVKWFIFSCVVWRQPRSIFHGKCPTTHDKYASYGY